MFRGMENILRGRDPRDAWLLAQRVCGTCTGVHALASVRAVENALGLTIPRNARLIRNLVAGTQLVADHVVHFYHRQALDWVDVMAALDASPARPRLARTVGDSRAQRRVLRRDAKRLVSLVGSEPAGLFAGGLRAIRLRLSWRAQPDGRGPLPRGARLAARSHDRPARRQNPHRSLPGRRDGDIAPWGRLRRPLP
jgi:Ni,Fe-hydrogenase I large subunit